jgi:hypothetical protein
VAPQPIRSLDKDNGVLKEPPFPAVDTKPQLFSSLLKAEDGSGDTSGVGGRRAGRASTRGRAPAAMTPMTLEAAVTSTPAFPKGKRLNHWRRF